MTLTLSDGPEVRSRQAAAIEIRAAIVGARTRTHTCTRADGHAPRRPGGTTATGPSIDIVEEWGLQSFPASDPPTNW